MGHATAARGVKDAIAPLAKGSFNVVIVGRC